MEMSWQVWKKSSLRQSWITFLRASLWLWWSFALCPSPSFTKLYGKHTHTYYIYSTYSLSWFVTFIFYWFFFVERKIHWSLIATINNNHFKHWIFCNNHYRYAWNSWKYFYKSGSAQDKKKLKKIICRVKIKGSLRVWCLNLTRKRLCLSLG